jgi:hypothetical protein
MMMRLERYTLDTKANMMIMPVLYIVRIYCKLARRGHCGCKRVDAHVDRL